MALCNGLNGSEATEYSTSDDHRIFAQLIDADFRERFSFQQVKKGVGKDFLRFGGFVFRHLRILLCHLSKRFIKNILKDIVIIHNIKKLKTKENNYKNGHIRGICLVSGDDIPLYLSYRQKFKEGMYGR